MFVLFLVFIVAPTCILIHELGHAVGAITVKANKVTINIGAGNHIKALKWGNVTLNVYTFYFLGGAVHNERNKGYSSLEIIWIALCGPLSSAIFALLFFIILQYITNEYIELFFYFHIWLAIMNIIPFKIKDKQSDGYIIIQAIFSRV